MEICRTCNGTHLVENFINPESGHRVKGIKNLEEHCYKKSFEIMKQAKEEYYRLKPENVQPVEGSSDPAIGWMMKKIMEPDNLKIQKQEAREFYKYNSVMEKCPDCGEIFERYYQLSQGKIAHKGLILDLLKKNVISKQFESLSEKDHSGFVLSGKPRNGKTLFLKYTYNKILRKCKDPKKLYFTTEMELFNEFREEKTFKGFMKNLVNIDYFFIDELLSEDNWKDANADRDKATITYRNLFVFWDTLSQLGNKCIFGTTNQVFGLFQPNKSSIRVFERIKELCEIVEID